MGTYVTSQGQTWDMVAKQAYGNELYADYLMQNNPEQIETFIFAAGVVINIPDIKSVSAITLPPWRR